MMAITKKVAARNDEVGACAVEYEDKAESIRALVGTAIRSLADPVSDIPGKMLQVLCARLAIEQGSMTLLEGESLLIAASWGHADAMVGKTIPRAGSIAWTVVKRGQEMHLSGVFDSRRTNYETFRHSLVLPIRSTGSVRGTLNINRRDAAFDLTELWLGQAVAAITDCVLHLEQALAEKRHPLLTGLNVALGLMSEEDRKTVAEITTIAARLAHLVGADGISPRLALAAAHTEVAGILMAGSPVDLEGDERQIVPALSSLLLRGLGADPRLCDTLAEASERWDGSGPQGLGGEELSLEAQLLALARAVAWQETSDLAAAVRRAHEEAPGRFSPQLIAEITKALDQSSPSAPSTVIP